MAADEGADERPSQPIEQLSSASAAAAEVIKGIGHDDIAIAQYRNCLAKPATRAIKTGCNIEALGFHTEERLQPVIALLSVVGVFLLQLRDLSRRPEAKQRRATEVVPVLWVEVLSRWRHGEVHNDWTVHEFFYALARLGGHQNRKHDGMPGWLTIWRGWTKLQPRIETVLLMRRKMWGKLRASPGYQLIEVSWPRAGPPTPLSPAHNGSAPW